MGSTDLSSRRRPPQLARELRFGDVVRLTLSSITPASGVFAILPSTIVAIYWGTPLAIVGAAVLCIPIAYCYTTLGAAFPAAGGEYSFAARFFGPAIGQASWLAVVAGVTLAIATILQGAASLLFAMTGLDLGFWTLPLLVLIPLLVAPQRVLQSARITSVMLTVELAALTSISMVGLFTFAQSGTSLGECHVRALAAVSALDPAQLLASVSVAFFALSGFGSAVILGEEDRELGHAAARAVGWSLVISVVLVLVAVVAVILGLGCSPISSVVPTAQVLSEFPVIRDSRPLRVVVLGGGFIAAVNAVIVITMQLGRIVYSAARDGYLPPAIGRRLKGVHPRTQTPIAATLTVIVGSCTIGALVPPPAVVAWTSATMLIPPAVVAASRLAWNHERRVKQADPPPRRLDLIPIAALVGLGLVGIFVLGTDPTVVWVGVAAWVVGLVHERVARRRMAAGEG